MPSTLGQLSQAWREEARQKIRKTILNQSRRTDRKWQEMVGKEPMRRLHASTERTVRSSMPRVARQLSACEEVVYAARMDRLFAEHAD